MRVFAAVKAILRKTVSTLAVILLACVAGRAADEVSGWLVYNGGPSVSVLKKEGATRAIVLAAGLSNSGKAVFDLMGQKLSDEADASIVTIQYGPHDFDEAQLYRLVMKALDGLKPQQVMLYGGSLGAQLDGGLAARYKADNMPYGELLLLFDHPTSSMRSIKPPMPITVFRNLRWFGGGVGATLVKAPIVWATLVDVYTNENLDAGKIAALKRAMILCPWPAFAAQASYADKHPITNHDLREVVAATIIVTGPELDDDPVVHLRVSLAEWTTVVGHVEHVIDYDRAPGEHNSAAERPTLIAKLARRMFEQNAPATR